MPATLPPFRLLSPAEYALLSAEEKTRYLFSLADDIGKHMQRFREHNKRVVHWLLHKDGVPRLK